MAMNELVQILVAKTGLSQDKAQEVVDTVVTHLKARLPGPLASHLDGILNGLGGGELEVLEQKAKSMFPGL
jgi:nucleoid DNA-binding protein